MVSKKVRAYVSLLLFFGFFGALLVGLNAVTVWKWHRQQTLLDAPTVQGVVLGKYMGTSTKGTPSYSVRYSYEVSGTDGQPQSYEVSNLVAPDTYQQAAEGNSITVRYLLSKPSVSDVGTPRSLSYWYACCLILDGIALAWVMRVLLSLRKR